MSRARIAIAALSLSAAALVARLTAEGYTTEAVIPTQGDVPTVGFGTTEGVKMGDKTNPVQAVQRALSDVQKYEGGLKRCVSVPLHQAEYDAYVELSYNIGTANFCYSLDKAGRIVGPSTLAKRLAAQDYAGACEAILLYKFAAGFDCSTPGNKRCAGVWKDRLRVHSKCIGAQ